MSKTALLLMDLQNGILSHLKDDSNYNRKIQQLIKAAREAAVPIIYVVVKFREHFPEVSPTNKAFLIIKSGAFPLYDGNPAAEIHADFAPQPHDIIVIKRRVGAFSGSDLEVVLRSQGIQHVVLAGLATSGVVLSTLRVAADMDYEITVLSDCCGDRDPEVHKVLMEKVFPSQAEVITAKQWQDKLGSKA